MNDSTLPDILTQPAKPLVLSYTQNIKLDLSAKGKINIPNGKIAYVFSFRTPLVLKLGLHTIQ